MKIGRASLLVLFVLCLLGVIALTALTTAAAEVSPIKEKVDEAIKVLDVNELTANANTEFAGKIKSTITSLRKAQSSLLTAEDRETASEDNKESLNGAATSIGEAIRVLSSTESLHLQAETQKKIGPVRANLIAALTSLNTLNRAAGTTSPNPSPSPPPDKQDEGFMADLMAYALPLLKVAAVVVVLGLLIYSLITLHGLRRATAEYFTSVLPQTIAGVKKRQDDLARQIEASAAVNKDINQRLADVHAELRQMSRLLQQTALTSNRQPASPASYSERPAAPVSDMPVFPISADDLLRQMHRKSVIVKRDFQNDMLVSDPDGKGELVLIRDSQIPDELQPLFIVPSVTQFQMRQEYYNFYEKYYDCAKPESGAVWILDPAVVEKVAGGWELREKGRLEVR